MITHVLDTNAVISLLSGKSQRLANRIIARPTGAVALPTIVAHELYFGAFRSQKVAHNLETLRLLAADVTILDFDAKDALVSGELRASLADKATPIGPYDVLIAGQAKARGLTVVTNNIGEFTRVPGLSVEDWSV